MISAILTATFLTFIFATNKIPTTPDKFAQERAHDIIEDAITEINKPTEEPVLENIQ